MIWTEEQKTEMQRLRDEGMSNNAIGQLFNTSGDNIRKVLARFCRNCGKPLHATPEAAPDGLTRLHDAYRAASRPKWAGRPPLRITPKDFQR